MSGLPAVRDDMLYAAALDGPVPVGGPQWLDWLHEARSFTFASAAGTFTARREERSGRPFWYAYRQRAGVLRKVYLGRATELTPEHLERAARTLAREGGTAGRDDAREDTQDEWSSPLIATKIAPPQPAMSLIARPEAVARCLESIERTCAIITAPPGFGKTTLLMMVGERLRERGWKVAWVSLEETERDPVRFWTYALAALESAQPGIGAGARRMLETPRPQPIERILTALINELAAATTPIALVLDDYHRAATPASDAGLTFLVEHAPAVLHLVIATRADPAMPLARLRAQGRIGEVHAADLRFSLEEARRFMRETMHVALPEDQLVRLDERTEGWVAGLQLAALSLRDQADTPDLLADLSATPRYIAEYLIDEVVEHQPADVQAFLLKTAPLERLTGPLCDAVTGQADGAAMLARLTQAQLFVTPLDAGRTWYRYHHLFAEVLRERLARTAPETLEECHRRAAAWLRDHRMTGEAIRHLVAARAFTDAAALIEGESDRLVLRGETAGLVEWTRALPREVALAHPHLCVLFVTGLFLQGGGTEASVWLDNLEQRLAELGTGSVEIEGEISVVRALLRLIGGDFVGGAALASEALKQLSPRNHLLRGLALWLTNLVGVLGNDDLAETTRRMEEIVEESVRAGNMLIAFMALVTKAGIELYQGRLHRAVQTCHEALELAARAPGPELPIAVLAYCLLGEVRREWNDLDGAEADLDHALSVATPLSSPEFINDGLISLAMVRAARGRYDDALAIFEEVRRLVRSQQLMSWDISQMEIMRVRVLIAQGHLAEAARWAEEYRRDWQQQSPQAALALLREMEDLALARVALAQGRAGEAVTLLEPICAAVEGGRVRNVLEARMLQARARWMLGEHEEALCALEESLVLAAPEGFMRVYLDEGEPMADVLAGYVAARAPSRERTHALKLLASFGRAVEPSTPDTADILSAREMDVLRLLATGRSNEAIASELVVALSTVKWHVAHIYRKLGVTSRMRAVARARELRLIA